MSRRTWTYPELRDAAERFAAGESWKSIAEPYGVRPSTLRNLINKHGLKIERTTRPPRKNDKLNMMFFKAISLRNTKNLSWALIAEEVGWGKTPHRLRELCCRCAKENRMNLAMGFPKVRKRRKKDEDTMLPTGRESRD